MSKKYTLCALVVSAILLSGCQSSGADYAADVYDTAQLNSKQETKTVNIISVLPAKVKVDNKAKEGANKQVISSQADSLIKISRIWADFFPANTS
ncbi:hypothetical protein ACRWX4_25320, partial [Escherichia coli]